MTSPAKAQLTKRLLGLTRFGLFFSRHTKFRGNFVWPQSHIKVAQPVTEISPKTMSRRKNGPKSGRDKIRNIKII